ncbi:MAG: Na+/H+ antiporter subunit D [Syntrophomonadaceae bacterium]|nr:Na+/H+ antiporter subunit D [Syntrophomonadaceae bacterium]
MNNLVCLPIVIPLFTALIFVLFKEKILFQRIFTLISLSSIIFAVSALINDNLIMGVQTLQIGDWAAPFGITLVADMLALILVLVSSVIFLCVMLYAFFNIDHEREVNYFYSFLFFLMTGVNGSFLTGDIFNLFVFFEVMLVASYALVSLGGTKIQLRESIKYIVINLFSSMLFLVAVAYLYAMLGTLNMAHISILVAEAGQEGLLITVALLFLVVFGIKAGLFLFFWLPGSYSAPPTAISAIFAALLTKVGIYAIIRTFSLIFYHDPQITHSLIGVLAAITMILGALGAVAYWDIRRIMTYNVVVSVGFILAGFASFTYEGILGSVFYLIHDIIVKAFLFLLGGTLIYITQTDKINETSGLMRLYPKLGWMFFIAALAISGIPPLSGFVGKIYITMGTFKADYYWLGAIGLVTSLMVLYSLMKIFMNCFWGNTTLTPDREQKPKPAILLPLGILTALTIFLGLGAESIIPYVDLAANTILNPSIYIEAVLGQSGLLR